MNAVSPPRKAWTTEAVGACVTAAFVVGILFDTVVGIPFDAMKDVPRQDPVKDMAVLSPLKTENDLLRARLTLGAALRFEREMHLKAGFDNCEDRDGTHYCTAVTDPGLSLVSYHCTVDRCVMDCTK